MELDKMHSHDRKRLQQSHVFSFYFEGRLDYGAEKSILVLRALHSI